MNNVDVGSAGDKGRGLFARRSLLTRDTIYHISSPLLIAISTSDLASVCYNCYAVSKPITGNSYSIGQNRDAHLQVCTGCRIARFCGKSCQTQAWRQFHKHECKIFAKLKSQGMLPESARALLRFLLQHDKGLLPDKAWSDILSLESHVEELKGAGSDWMTLILTTKACKEYSGTTVDFDTVLKLLCILKVNGMALTTTDGDEVGVFLDPILSRMNHSCDGGNVYIYRPVHTNHVEWLKGSANGKSLLKLLPLKDIAEGEELTVTYVEHTDSVQKRRQSLAKQYIFHCTCSKCQRDQSILDDIRSTASPLLKSLQSWSDTVEQQFNVLKKFPVPPHASTHAIESLTEVVHAMERDLAFSAEWNPYPQAIHQLKLLHTTDNRDQALIYAFKEFFIVAPVIYVSPLNPRCTVQTMFLLQILSLLAGTYDQFPPPYSEDIQNRLEMERRGFSQSIFTYWRLRICVTVRSVLLRSPVVDLADVLKMEQAAIGIRDQKQFAEILGEGKIKSNAEDSIRGLLLITKEKLDASMKWWEMSNIATRDILSDDESTT